MLANFAGIVLWLLTTTGVGIVVRRTFGGGTVARAPAALSALTGACALAALLPALFLLGAGREVTLLTAYATAALGFVRWGRAALLPPDRRTLFHGALLLLALGGPLLAAAHGPLLAEDAVLVWWPKVEEVAAGRWPELHAATTLHSNPGYPRGMAWLTNLASPWAAPTPPTMLLVAWTWTWLSALAMAAFARAHCWPRAGLALAGAFVLLPDVALHAGQGMADGAVGGAILLAAIGLSTRQRDGNGLGLAIAAAVGAPSLKEEGKLVLLVVGAFLLLDVCRRRLPWARALPAAAAPLVLVPFWWAKAGDRATRLDVLPALLHDPDMLVARLAAVLEHMFRRIGEGPMWAGLAAIASLLLLLPRHWPRPLSPWPALVFLPVATLVYVATGVPVRWHVATTLDRLMIEVLPTLLLAAGLRLAPPPTPAPG